jgi:Carboxypeptidase regulatory-like domain
MPLPSPLPRQSISSSLEPLAGDIHGYVGGPGGLPAIGATVVAAEQQTGYTVNSIVSIDGKYSFSLPLGKYIVMVAYPDGTSKKVSNLQLEQGVANSLDFKY